MGKANRQSVYIDEMYYYAKQILIEIGIIKECFCGKIFYKTYILDNDEIYARATNKLKEKIGEQFEYNTFHKQINIILDEAHSENDCDCD